MSVEMSNLITEDLLKRKSEILETFPKDVALRVHRSLSWLTRAEGQQDDDDAAFIFYWLAFNALYAREKVEYSESIEGERGAYKIFFEKIAKLDKNHRIYDELWHQFSDPVRNLMRNKYVYQPFWNHYNQIPGNENWEERFEKTKEMSLRALQREDTTRILDLIFDRLYVLRNQVFHGAATWQSSVNREQIKDSKNILAFMVPIFVDLMMSNPNTYWGRPCYLVVEQA